MRWLRRIVLRLSTKETLRAYRTELLYQKGKLLLLRQASAVKRELRLIDADLDDVNAELMRRGLV